MDGIEQKRMDKTLRKFGKPCGFAQWPKAVCGSCGFCATYLIYAEILV
jgi:hypothetical protein